MRLVKLQMGLLLLAMVATAGCGGEGGVEKVQIKGTVNLDGSPLAGASIAFVGNNGGTFGTATTDAKGVFTLRAAIGINKVSVAKSNPEAAKPADPNVDQTMGTYEDYVKSLKSLPKPSVAERYGDPARSGIQFDVGKGMPALDIDVTSK